MSLLGRQLWKDAELELRIEDNRVVKRRARNVDLLIAFRSWVETEPTPAEEEGVWRGVRRWIVVESQIDGAKYLQPPPLQVYQGWLAKKQSNSGGDVEDKHRLSEDYCKIEFVLPVDTGQLPYYD